MGILDFELFQIGDVFDQIKDNPARLLYGGIDPFSTAIWNGLLGRDDEPILNQFGGPTEDRFQRAEAKGVDTGFARDSHSVAQAIASVYGGVGASNALGGLTGGTAATTGGGGILGAGGGATGGAGLGGGAGGASGASAAGGAVGGASYLDYANTGLDVLGLLGGGQDEQLQPVQPVQLGVPGSRAGVPQVIPPDLLKLIGGGDLGGIEDLKNKSPELFANPQVQVPESTEQAGSPREDFETGPEKKASIKGFLSQFAKGIDSTLSSPSKQLGIGLLGQIDPRLAFAGLLAGGLFGEQ